MYKPIDLRKFAISQVCACPTKLHQLYSHNITTNGKLRQYFQVEYVLGENPMRMSYLVGYGSEYPRYIHHRGSSIPVDAKTGCRDGFKWYDSAEPNPNVAFGALVGGPFFNETYDDFRNNSMQGEPTTYSNALLVGLLSGLVATSSVAWSF